MKYRDLARRLRELDCEHVRDGAGSQKIWWNSAQDRYTTIPDWGAKDFRPGTVRPNK
jgi:hypothetical protein